MAFVNKIGNVLKQTASKNANLDLSASYPSIYQAIRCMSSKLFVGGISYNTDETSLREAFAQYGDVTEAKVILDRETGQSRGFGFVSFTTEEAASSAMQALDGQDLHGRRVRVSYANERASGFRGGFGGDSGYVGGGDGYGDSANNYRSIGNHGGNNSYGSGGDVDNYGSNSYGGGANNFRSGGNYGGDNNCGSGGDAGNYGSNSYGGGENRYAAGETSGFGGGNSNFQQR